VERDIAVAEEAVTRDPTLLTARLALAQAYARNARFDDAIEQYDEILRVAPDAGSGLLGRGSARIALEQLDAAAADFGRIVELAERGEMAQVDPQLEAAYYGLGVIALRQERPQDAVQHLANAVEIKRTDADALHLLGTALLQVGEPQRAVTATRHAIALVPVGWCEPYAQLGSAYTALADTAGSAYAAGMVAMCEGRAGEARAALGALTAGPYAVDALVGLGLVAETESDMAAARDAYARALEKDPDNFAATTGLARAGGEPATSPAPSSPSGSTGGI
jgi:tetratricopeptide (TPR) repeat protein